MAIPKFLEDVKIISKLGDFPRSDDNLSPEQFRAKFDEGAQLIKDFLNNDLIPNINAIVDVQALLNSVIDKTLTLQDKAAEAKAVGEALAKKLSLSGGTMTGSIDMGSNAIENVPYPTENAHPATKGYVDNHKVDRAHLKNDALYSPVKASSTATQYYFVESDLGRTIMPSSGADSSDITYILSDTLANALPYGAEIAVCFRFGKSLKIKLEGEIYSAMVGDSGMQKAKTYQIQERYGMVALKKINYTDTYTSWLVTGNVEVV